jgi:hypothetical protein
MSGKTHGLRMRMGQRLVDGLSPQALEGEARDSTTEMIELAMRICLSDPVMIPLAAAVTNDDIDLFRIHVLRLRLRGHLSEELALRLLGRADQKALTLLP